MKHSQAVAGRLAWIAGVPLALALTPWPALAFGPAAHVTLVQTVRDRLPGRSAIRRALAAQEGIAAAGANGPDINYASLRGVLDGVGLGYAPWADRYHYHLVGSLAATQLRQALQSGDKAQIAWAAGWVTHVTGDLACHGIYVNPEAGVYLANPDGRELHRRLEQWAEPFVWVDIGRHSKESYSKSGLGSALCHTEDLPADLLQAASKQVFGIGPGAERFRTWYSTYRLGVRRGIGYSYVDYAVATEHLSHDGRRRRLTQAFAAAVDHAVDLLSAAEAGDFSGFSDAWNLDAAREQRPIGTLTVTIHTADSLGAGTDADIYFGLQSGDELQEWLLDKTGYDDFERGDTDDYYLYAGYDSFAPEKLTGVRLRMGKRSGLGPDWKCAWIRVWVNGHPTRLKVDRTFKAGGAKWEAPIEIATGALKPPARPTLRVD